MATYTILVPAGSRPGHLDALETAVAVKNRFRWWALVVPLPFALLNRLWRPFVVLLALTVVIGVLAARDLIADEAAFCLDLLLALYAGLAAPDWIVAARERRGYVAMGAVSAEDEDEALAQFARHWMDGQVAPPVMASASAALAPRAAQGPVIGLFPESGGR